jgi:hypothetical protein
MEGFLEHMCFQLLGNSEFLMDGLPRFFTEIAQALVKSLRLNFGRF